MRKSIFIIALAIVISGCAAGKLPYQKSNSAKAQQAMAKAAEAEMEADIARGEPSLTMPKKPIVKREPVVAEAPDVKKQIIPEKRVNKLKSLKPVTKYPLKDGLPVWFYTPVYDGYIGSVGIAPRQTRGGMTAQKRVARMQAQKGLAKRINVLVKSELTVETTGVDTATVQHYRQKVTSLTREEADQFLTGFMVKDQFYDEKTKEYYIWMVLRR